MFSVFEITLSGRRSNAAYTALLDKTVADAPPLLRHLIHSFLQPVPTMLAANQRDFGRIIKLMCAHDCLVSAATEGRLANFWKQGVFITMDDDGTWRESTAGASAWTELEYTKCWKMMILESHITQSH